MIGLLNLIPFIIATLGLYWVYQGYKKKKDFLKDVFLRVVLTVAAVVLYNHFQPSYMPKGEVKRSVAPQFEYVEKEVKDVVPKPMSGEDRDSRRKEQYKEPLPWKEDQK